MHAVAAPEPTTTGLELGGEEPSTCSSSSHPADPTLETCCHEPPPIALSPLNSFLFSGEKVLRLPIPPTNDIVVSL